jgi:hypothetical protein
MPNGRVIVETPAFSPLQYGLLNAATDATQGAPSHWTAGVTWRSYCPVDGDTTYDPCLTTGAGEPAEKAETANYSLRGAEPFAVYARIDCSAPGFWDVAQEAAREALDRVEERQVAAAFESGTVGGDADTLLPHLAADAAVEDDTGAVLQTVATEIGAVGAPLDVVEAVGELEAALGTCYDGQGVIHVPAILAAALEAADLIRREGDQLLSPLGHRYAISSGYSGVGPDGVVTADVAWMYATGAVWYYRGTTLSIAPIEAFDRSVNTVEALAERVMLVAWDCCHFAVPVTTAGGV